METKKCPYCGREILSIAKKCKHCRMWINRDFMPKPNTIACPICGEQIDVGIDICSSCGEKIDNKTLETSFIQNKDIVVSPSEDLIKKINKIEHKSIMKKKIILWVGVPLILLFYILFFLIFSLGMMDKSSVDYNSSDQDNISLPNDSIVDSLNTSTFSSTTSTDEFDYWLGNFVIEGCMYRTCESLAYLYLENDGDGVYKGNVEVLLGDYIDESLKFDFYNGALHGNIRAKLVGNSLLVILTSVSVESGTDANRFEENHFKNGDQIFRITYNDGTYTALPLGKMEMYFDGGEIIAKKKLCN